MLCFIVLILVAVYWHQADSQKVSYFKTYQFSTATFTDRFRDLNQSIAQNPEYHLWAGKSHKSVTVHSCVITDRNKIKVQFRTFTMQNDVKNTLGDVKHADSMTTEEDSYLAAANAMLEDAIDVMLDMVVRLPSRSSAQQAAFAAQALARVDRTRLCFITRRK